MEVQNQDKYSNNQVRTKTPEISLLMLHAKLTEAKINWYPEWKEHLAICNAHLGTSHLGSTKIGKPYAEALNVLGEIEAGTKKRS